MSQADPADTRKPSRRRFLLTAPVAGYATGRALAPSPDADLLELGQQLVACWAVERRIDPHNTIPVYDARMQAAYRATSAVARRICSLPAATLDGLKVKAQAVAWCFGGADTLQWPDGLLDQDEVGTDTILLQGIARDLIAMGGAA